MSAKDKALKGKKAGGYSFHDLRKGEHRKVEYSEVRSALKKDYGKNSKVVREMFHKLKPDTSEAVPTRGGYYSRSKH